ncbi:MAG: sugar transporter ATP-binding protein [Aeromicrobium sp.]|nr:sugar transporter ATP-binding protein [Aeromicrobium sp.]
MPTPPLLEMRGIVKEFPGVRALDGVDLVVRPGEVHCLLGQNGAGKSTLIKVLSGAHAVDDGSILWNGEPISFADPQAALAAGVATIYQELDLIDGLSVADNIFLGHEKARGGITRDADMNRSARELLKTLGHPEIRPTREVGSLSSAGKQIVSMARALSRRAQIIVMDEPSAVLDPDEVDGLFRVIGDLRSSGAAIIYISHRLEEIRRIGDRLTVLKDGKTVASDLPARDTSTADLIKLMTGATVSSIFPRRTTGLPEVRPLLSVAAIGRDQEFDDVSFDVRPGEIIGLAGLVGAGRSEIIETIFGARKAARGTVTVDGKRLRNGSVDSAVESGLGLCPEERKSQGLILDDAVYRNISLASLDRYARYGISSEGSERRAAHAAARSVDVRPDDPDRIIRTLSGGNQQKVVLARWLLRSCKVLLLDEPTRGVDVGARAEIYALIRELADSGVALVIVSSDIDEVLGLSDRVLVIADGRVVHDGPSDGIDASGVLDRILAEHDTTTDQKGDAA